MVSNIFDYAMYGPQQLLTNPITITNDTNYQTHNLNKKRKKFFLYKMLNEHHTKNQSSNVFVNVDKVRASTDNLNSFKFNEVKVYEEEGKEVRKELLNNVTATIIEHPKSIKTTNIASTIELCPICRKEVIDNDENDLRYNCLCICRHQLESSQRVIRKCYKKQQKHQLHQNQKQETVDKRWQRSCNICDNKFCHINHHDHHRKHQHQQSLKHMQEQKIKLVQNLVNWKQYYQQQCSDHSTYGNQSVDEVKKKPLAAILSTPKAVSYLNNTNNISSLEITPTEKPLTSAIDNNNHNKSAKTLATIVLSSHSNIVNDIINDKNKCEEIPVATTTIRTNSASVPNHISEEHQLENSLHYAHHRHHYCCKTQHSAAITVTAIAAAATAVNLINSCWQKIFKKCLKIFQIILIFAHMQLENNLFNNNNILKRQPMEPQQQQYIQQEQCSSSIRLIDFFLNNNNHNNNNNDSNKNRINNKNRNNKNNNNESNSNNNNNNSSISIKQNYQNIYHHQNIQNNHNNNNSNYTSAGKYPTTNTSHAKDSRFINSQKQKPEQTQQQQRKQDHQKQQQQQQKQYQHGRQQQQQEQKKLDHHSKHCCCQHCHRQISCMNIAENAMSMTTSSPSPSLSLSLQLSNKNKSKEMPKLLHSKMFVILLFLMFLLPVTCAQSSLSATATIPPTKISIATPAATIKSPPSPVVRLARKEVVCPSMDMRNTPSALKLLKNCTVIEGFLLFTLVNTKNSEEFNETYPLLTEVTEFIVLFRVHKLRSLGQIFPNLSIIRGAELFSAAYALVIFSNPELEDLGLSKLISIPRGGVRIQGNKYLCFANTVDWKEITSNGADIYIKDNRPTEDCPRCPGSYIRNEESSDATDDVLTCKKNNGEHRCWNNNACQKICPKECPHNCYDENKCCNPACLGGCTTNPNECISCRNFSIHNSTCEDKCPSGYFSYLSRRCITAETCKRIGTKFEYDKESELVAFENECTTRCPQNYRLVNKTCEKCEKVCKRTCVGGIIDEVDRAKDFHGCTEIIDVGLSITIKRGGRHVYEALEFGLSSIQTIRTYLKVHNTYGMVSLSFFKNLESIGGEKLLDDRFALYVLENNDLARLWATNQTVKIENGNIYFHFNPKLCYSTIMALKPMMNDSTQIGPYEVSTDSNGSKVSCGKTILNATVVKIGSDMAEIIITNPVDYPDQRAFIGYQLLYMKNEEKNATKFDYNPCDAKWKLTDPYKTNTTIIDKLKPYTQYVFYIKTKTISSERNNVESPLYYFKTKSSQPTFVRDIKAYATSDSEILVNWLPPLMANGKLVTYNVSIWIDNRPSADTRNYCKLLDKPDTKPIEKPPPDILPQQPGTQQCATESDSKSGSTVKDGNKYLDDESVIDDFIAFENAIHNFVYIKKKGNVGSRPNPINIPAINISNSGKLDKEMSNKVRKRRSSSTSSNTELKTEYIFLSRHTRGVTNAILDNNINKTTVIIFDSRMDKNNLYYEEFTANVSSTTTQFKFDKLKPYSRYFVSVKACREPEEGASGAECSNEKKDDVRTLKRENVDIVRNFDASVGEVTNSSRGNVRLTWDPPEFPNGAVVSYTIEYQLQAQDAATEKKCVTEMDYQNMTNGYLLTGLSTGNYSIRVRANTIAGDGIFSAYRFVYIKPIQLSGTVIAIIILTVLLLVLMFIGGGIYMRKKILAPPSDLTMFPTVNPYYMSPPYIPDEWEVPRERIIQLNPLGQGSFGMVYEGILKGYNNSTEDTLCAIKTTNENATDRERINFLNEASVMKEFDTHHVVRLLGVCSRGQPALVIMELMKNGDLKSYLRAHRPDEQREDIGLPMLSGGPQPPPLSRLYQMAIEIADGMAYLAAKKYVHRDLAARNCMVAADLTVKIGDFGMTRDIYETDYYRKGTKGLLPVRWMPPESLRDGVYSSASDVFSYGVVLWEMATLAAQPYQGYSNDQVLHHVIDGGVMERPDNCPDRLYSLMEKCWLYRPSARPSFMEIIRLLNDMADPHFEEVSFYNSPEGQQLLSKQLAAKSHRPDDIYDEHDNNMDDATTPLHIGDYSGYKLNMANNFTIENQDESPMITVDDNLHSPYSLGSGSIANSASDKNSFSLLHKLHNPSISGDGGGGGPPPQYSSTSNLQHQHQYKSLQSHYQQNDDNIGTETDDGGYQIYDPSPNYREHAPYGGGDCNDDIDNDMEGFGSTGLNSKLSGGQNLLLGQKASKRLPTIMPMSYSMPDEIVRGGGTTPMVASSLHPSTASAASSNASSTTTATTGKRQSLKKAMAESLMPTRLLGKNRLFFQHKRSGSNSSHKSTGSNAPVSGVGSNSGSILGTQQILSTIESGGSGSAGSYCITPPTQKPSSTPADGAGYKLLDESANISGMSEKFVLNKPSAETNKDTITTAATMPTTATPVSTKSKPALLTGLTTSFNPNYQLWDKLFQTKNDETDTATSTSAIEVSENPNYVMMNEPFKTPAIEPLPTTVATATTATSKLTPTSTSASANTTKSSAIPNEIANISVNPNYLTMTPNTTLLKLPLKNSLSLSSPTCSASSISEEDEDAADECEIEKDNIQEKQIGEHIPMIRLSQQQQQLQQQQMLSSKTKGISSSKRKLATVRQRSQKLLKQRRQPPPNGFIGPETT